VGLERSSSLRFDAAEWRSNAKRIADRLPFHPFTLEMDGSGERGLADGRQMARLEAALSEFRGDDTEELFSAIGEQADPDLVFAATLVLQHLLHARSGLPRVVEVETPLLVPRGEVRVFPGNLIVEGPCRNEGTIVVAGDLMLQGLYEDEEESSLFVAGEAAIASLSTAGAMYVGGDLDTELLHGRPGAPPTLVGGVLTARITVDEGHPVHAERLAVRDAVGPKARDVRRLFLPDLVDDEAPSGAELRVGEMVTRLRRGLPVIPASDDAEAK
jgi:hypothetical protein